MIERPFGFDPLTGATETFYYDEATGESHIKRSEDIAPILETAEAHRNLFRGPGGGSWKGNFHRVASIPLSVYHEKLVKTGKIKDQNEVKRFLNDPDNRVFRTRPGRV